MTPVLHAGYGNWRANPPRPPERLLHDPDWDLKLDRVAQFYTVSGMTAQMIQEGKPRSLAFVWYGKESQGILRFHKRLSTELRKHLFNTSLMVVRPEWPADFVDSNLSFSDMLKEAFEISHLADVSSRIRNETKGASGKQTLVYIRHQPVSSSKLINPKILKRYLQWWNAVFAPLLEKNQFALLGVSFRVKKPAKFKKVMLEKEKLNELFLDQTVFRLLGRLKNLDKKDLLDFLNTHNIRLPGDLRDGIIGDILTKTEGRYEETIEELKVMVAKWWDYSPEYDQAPGDESDDDDDNDY
ncbi:MAG: hypothetical protein GY859_13800, partial [Desulfobacterales bacterium]|nr:hypothetical protein [Desulfobacterales bacterium]